MQKFKIFVFFLALFLFTDIRAYAFRVGFWNETWLTTKTEHFDIIHSAQQQDLGLYYAKIAETAYKNLMTVFYQAPQRITVVINDSTDIANGYATVIPYPLIMIYPVQVTNEETLSEAGEWARELFTHELTHILQLYPANGVYNFIRPVFGSIISPNLLMPNWWKEGMGIEMETRFSPQGRSRSNLQNASLRSLVNDERLSRYTIAEANEALRTWPYGNRPYYFGSIILSELGREVKLSGIGQITHHQSYRAPFFINTPVEELSGKTYKDIFQQAIDRITEKALSQIRTLSSIAVNKLSPVDADLLASRNPRFNPQTKQLALIGLLKSGWQILVYEQTIDPANATTSAAKVYQRKKLKKKISGDLGSFEFHPTENKILYSKVDDVNSKELFSDLYLYDLNEEQEKQLTKSERAREAKFSPSGTVIVYVTTANGKTELQQMNLSTQEKKTLLTTEFEKRITTATFLSEDSILIAIRNALGEQELVTYNLKDSSQQTIPTPPKQFAFPRVFENRLYFSSTENGVANIYSTAIDGNLFKSIQSETHFLTGTLSFDIFNDYLEDNTNKPTLLTTQVGSSGSFVNITDFANRNQKLPTIQNEISARYVFTPNDANEIQMHTEDYSVWPQILPHYWIPFVSTNSSNKGLFIQALTSGQDPLNIHNYQVSVNYDTYLQKGGFNFNYINSALAWPIQASALQSQQTFGSTTNVVQKNAYSLGVMPDVFKISKNLSFSLGGVYNQTDNSLIQIDHSGIYAQLLYSDYEKKIFQYFPMSGWAGLLRFEDLKARRDNGALYGDYSKTLGSFLYYFSKFLPEDHSIMFKFDGLYNSNNMASLFGTSTAAFPIGSDTPIPLFVLRGYPDGQFFGSQILSTTFEYRFPIKDIDRGSGTTPFFIKTLTGAVVADGVATKGYGINTNLNPIAVRLNEQFWSAGVEARLSTTVGYVLPLKFILGYYVPFSPAFADSGQMSLSLQLGGY